MLVGFWLRSNKEFVNKGLTKKVGAQKVFRGFKQEVDHGFVENMKNNPGENVQFAFRCDRS